MIGAALSALALAGCSAPPSPRHAAPDLPPDLPGPAIAVRASSIPFSYQAENALPGTSRAQMPAGWTSSGQLEGFLGQQASTAARRSVQLYINSTYDTVRIYAYRIGDYAGIGQRLVWKSPPVRVQRQPDAVVDEATRMVSCPWRPTTTIDTSGWPEGFYYLVLTAGQRHAHMIPLVVESASLAGRTVLVFNDLTMQAYNRWGGASLYRGPDNTAASRSYKVSFDRPYAQSEEFEQHSAPMVRAAEGISVRGVALGYATEARLASRPEMLRNARTVAFGGHSEYWSLQLRRGVESARDRGTNVVFFGANNVYWRARTERSTLGEDRVLVCYREEALDPLRITQPDQVTTRWRDGPRPDPESLLTGAAYGDLRARGLFTVSDPSFLGFAGTGVHRGDTFPGLTGGETDTVYRGAHSGMSYPPGLRIVARSPEEGGYSRHGTATTTVYTASSGARVVNMASLDWLPAQNDPSVPPRSREFARRVTQNVLRELAARPAAVRVA